MSKMPKNHNWVKFYFKDWQLDINVQSCSYGARGLWVELIGFMTRSDRYGYLELNGQPMTITQIANLTNGHKQYVIRYLAELEKKGVLSKDENGVIFCRRMIRSVTGSVTDSVTISVTDGVTKTVTQNGGKQPINQDRPIYQNKNKNKEQDNIPPLIPPIGEEQTKQKSRAKPSPTFSSKGSCIPPDWEPGENERAYALKHELNLEKTVENFRDYWLAKAGKEGLKRDWNAAWRTWCRKAIEFKNVHSFPGQKQQSSSETLWDCKDKHDEQFEKLSRSDQGIVNFFEKSPNYKDWFINHLKNHNPSAYQYLVQKGLLQQKQEAA